MDEERRKLIATAIINEATSYYKLVVSVATVFLGGTIAFWEKITPTPTAFSLVLLGTGWLFLISTIAVIGFVRRDNIEAGRCELVNQTADSDKIGRRSRRWTTGSTVLLSLGMFFVAASGMTALWSKVMADGKKVVNTDNIETRSIPFREIAGGGGQTQTQTQTQQGGSQQSGNSSQSNGKK